MARPTQELVDSVHRRIRVALKIVLACGAVMLFWSEQYQAAMETLLILSITFAPMLLHSHFRVRLPYEFESLTIIFVCLTLFFGEVLDFYNRLWWWDMVMHAWSAFLLGITGFVLVYVLNENEKIELDLSPGFIAFFACMFAISMGALWEIFEYFMDQTFGMNMQKSGLPDTMWDLIMDTIGAVTISALGYGYLKTQESDSFLERWIGNFITNNPHFFHDSHDQDQKQDTGQDA
ncbi:MAG TPA: hypothetical protein GX696_06225 [Pseudomonadaceae bacterium]|nr:hypothetical protein [Pseudomonadaceae bacterium]